MSDASKAIFLSYASQDAEAAKRICDSLRAAGVEVWFDQSELRGGDSWDAKIRKQIRECALFVPVISANTQARREGYFRIEWKLAAQRTHAIAEGTPFLLPVLLGDVGEPEALVPPEFREVHWSRLRAGESPTPLATHVRTVLLGDLPAGRYHVPAPAATSGRPRTPARWLKWVAIGAVAVGLGLASRPLWQSVQPADMLAEERLAVLLRESREQTVIAEEATQRATEKDPNSARTWAARAFVQGVYLIRGWDTGEKRRQDAQAFAQRALAIDPNNTTAISVLANVFIVQGAYAEAEAMARRALRVRPDDIGNHRALAISLSAQGNIEEAVAMLEEAVRRFPMQGGPLYNLALMQETKTVPDFEAALRSFEAAQSAPERPEPSANILIHKSALLAGARGDLAGARAVLEELSPVQRMEDRAVGTAMVLGLFERAPARVIAAGGQTARDFFEDLYVPGPKAWLLAHAHRLEGKESLAQREWQTAETVLRQRLTANPASQSDQAALAVTLAWLGRRDEAAKLIAPIEAQVRESPPRVSGFAPDHLRVLYLCYYYAGSGDAAPATGYIRRLLNRRELLTGRTLPFDPWWDRIRDQPEFASLLAEERANAKVATAPALLPVPTDKSIAVLPFVNASDDKENTAFFSDGVQEDILTNLANVREFRVISRTSVEQYRTTTKPIPQIARELGVAYVLEGSVRRAGNQVHVTGQLIRAGYEGHLWANAYNRDLSAAGIFAIQAELAQDIASALKTTLSPQEMALVSRLPTANQAAYDLYMKSREVRSRELNSPARDKREIALLTSATQADPLFADAWADLSRPILFSYFNNNDRSPEWFAQAKSAIETAARLAPESPLVQLRLATYHYWGLRDYNLATAEVSKLIERQPNFGENYSLLGAIQRRQGKWPEALANFRKVAELDPAFVGNSDVLATLLYLRRYPEALVERNRIAAIRRAAGLDPSSSQGLQVRYNEAYISFRATGSKAEVEAFLGSLTPALRESPRGIFIRKGWAIATGDYGEAVRLDRIQGVFDEDGSPGYIQALQAAAAAAALGDRNAAQQRLAESLAQLRANLAVQPDNAARWSDLALVEAIRGNAEPALAAAKRAAELMPESRDAIQGPAHSFNRAFVYAWIGDKDRAIAELTRLLRIPQNNYTVHELRRNPLTFPLQGDPRFEALLDDPKNNAPLF